MSGYYRANFQVKGGDANAHTVELSIIHAEIARNSPEHETTKGGIRENEEQLGGGHPNLQSSTTAAITK